MLCLLGAGFLIGRWFLRFDALGRRGPKPYYRVGFLVVAAGLLLTVWFLRIRLEHRLSAAASTLIGSSVTVHCQTFGEALGDLGAELGYVEFSPDGVPEPRTTIKRDQCRDLSAYLRSDKESPTREQTIAVHTLTHEAIHLSGETSEAVTECLAVQRDAEMARLLGASPGGARALVRDYWVSVYPEMPADYLTTDCVDEGPLDAELPDAPWELVAAE